MNYLFVSLYLLFPLTSPCLRQSPGGGSPGELTFVPIPTFFLDIPSRPKLRPKQSPTQNSSSSSSSTTTTTTTTSTTTTTTTTTTPTPNPSIFVSNNILEEDFPVRLPADKAIRGETRNCVDGKIYSYNKSTVSDWATVTSTRQFAFSVHCERACACVTTEDCYLAPNEEIALAFAPFCLGDSCAMYILTWQRAHTSLCPGTTRRSTQSAVENVQCG
uniref:Uncharacterized protein n=1 Tax=Steinernema glaseri TaxID=37863 RepID=A0A1I8ATR5_9BILA